MERIENYFETKPEIYKVYTLQEMYSFLGRVSIKAISLTESEILQFDDNFCMKNIYNTEDYPFCIEGNMRLRINPDYYLKNTDKMNAFLEEFFTQNLASSLIIGSNAFMTTRLLQALAKNQNLKELTLTKYCLTLEHYKILKNSFLEKVDTYGVCEELKENFDPLIVFNYEKKLFGKYTYKDLAGLEDANNFSFPLCDKVTAEELSNLKYLQNDNLTFSVTEENMESAIAIFDRLAELGKKNIVVIEVKNKKNVLEKIFQNSEYLRRNIKASFDLELITLDNFFESEKKLWQLVGNTKNLSPFEKFIYDYNTTKKYKQYRENSEDLLASRNLYSILDNEYMVCVGYSNLLGDLLDKEGIPSIDHGVSVDISYDTKGENEQVVTTGVGHARRYVYINDPKYDIDGFYVTDPTWDNDMDKDLYNHLILTNEEEAMTKRYNFMTMDVSELFNVNSMNEFYQKLNVLLKRQSDIGMTLSWIIRLLLTHLKKLTPSYCEYLLSKYPELNSHLSWPNEDKIIEEIGNYILSKVNKPLSGEKIMKAVKSVYINVYHLEGEALNQTLEKIIKDNCERQKKSFPKRYKIDVYGNQVEMENIADKFDIVPEFENIRKI